MDGTSMVEGKRGRDDQQAQGSRPGRISFQAHCSAVEGSHAGYAAYEIAVDPCTPGAPAKVLWPEQLLSGEVRPGDRLEILGVMEGHVCRADRIVNISQGTVLTAPSPRGFRIAVTVTLTALAAGLVVLLGTIPF